MKKQVWTSRNWKPSQRKILSKDAGLFHKISFFSKCFSHIFTIANQLPGFSISRLTSVEEFCSMFFNVYIYIYIYIILNYIYIKYKYIYIYICEYKRLFFLKLYLSSMLLKILFLLPHLFCNVEFEFSWLHNTNQSSDILILKIEMLL